MQHYQLRNNASTLPNQSNPDWERVAAGMTAPTLTVGQARRMSPGSPVKIRGVARPGPSGPLTAPLSGTPCVWYRCYVQYASTGFRPRPLPPAGRVSDLMLIAAPTAGLVPRYDGGDEISETPFQIVDADGAVVTIDPRIADVHSDGLTRNRVEGSRFGFASQLLIEWVVLVDAPVIALGTIATGMDLDASAGAFQFVSNRSEARIVDRAAHGVGQHDATASMFRFVAVTARFSRGLRTGTRVVFALGVLALVIAILVAIVV